MPLGTTTPPRTGRLGQSAESLCRSPPVSAGPVVAGGGGGCAATALLRSWVGAGVALECWPLDSEEASPRGWGDGLAAAWILGLLWDPATPLLVTLGVWSPPRAQIGSVCEPESGRGCVPWSLLQVAVLRFHLSPVYRCCDSLVQAVPAGAPGCMLARGEE